MVLNAAGKLGAQTSPEKLAGLTLTVIEGEDGGARKEVDRLIAFLRDHVRPEVISLPNLMFVGMARAFRDYKGTVHFLSVSSVAYQSLGPNLDSLQHSCEPAFSSTNDGNPADYNDAVWLTSFYTFDGKTIAASITFPDRHSGLTWTIAEAVATGGNEDHDNTDQKHERADRTLFLLRQRFPSNRFN